MDLVLWRHAEAEDEMPQGDDMRRPLTPRGEKLAARMAAWLDRQLPDVTRIWVSPARRAEQTALILGRKYKVSAEIAPGATPDQLLALVQWSQAKGTVLVVGHQPTLGQVAARLLGLRVEACAIRKGAIWWLRQRERDGVAQTVLLSVQSPELL